MALWFGTWLRHFKRPIGLAIAEPEVQVISLCDKELCSFALDDILNGDCWLYVGPSSLLVFLWSFGEHWQNLMVQQGVVQRLISTQQWIARTPVFSSPPPPSTPQSLSTMPYPFGFLPFALTHTWISSCFFVQHLCQHSRALSGFFFRWVPRILKTDITYM